jgi:predicted house-cleaning NTP pyrophosphatase (Maf/HAM1 superfamily)
VKSGKWRGRAGAYAIRPRHDPFVENVRGNVDNVIGMPVSLLRKVLSQLAAATKSRVRKR